MIKKNKLSNKKENNNINIIENNNGYLDIFMKIYDELKEINGNFHSQTIRIDRHEARISKLEEKVK